MSDTEAEARARAFLAVLRERQADLERLIAGVLKEYPRLEAETGAPRPPKVTKASKQASSGAGVFEKKYEKSSSEYFVETLRQADGPLALSEINRRLHARNIEFHRETLTYAGKQLVKKGIVKKLKAPPESNVHWLYELRKDGQQR